jgi:BMFP domain-containing protein YqiC
METRKMSTGANRILDDLARLMTDAAGAAQGVRREVEAAFRAQTENWLNSLDVVKREEFEAVKEMAARARDENDALLARIEALEARLAATGPAAGDITTGK